MAMDKVNAGASATSVGAVGTLFLTMIMPMQEDITTLEADINRLETAHVKVCQIEANYFRGRAADKRDAANAADNVAKRTRALRDYLASQDPPQELPLAEINRLADYERQFNQYSSEASILDQSVITVCQ